MQLELMGVAEIAQALGVSRQRVHALQKTHDDFPKPVAELSAGKIWLSRAIEAWARRDGRFIPPAERAASDEWTDNVTPRRY